MLTFFTEGPLRNLANRDVLTPMVQIKLQPWEVPLVERLNDIRQELYAMPSHHRALSLQWLHARVDKTHGLPESADAEVLRQLISGEWDVEAEAKRLIPLADMLYRAQLMPAFIYLNVESWMGAGWSINARDVLVAALKDDRFVARLPAVLRQMLMSIDRAAALRKILPGEKQPDGSYVSTNFDRKLLNILDGWLSNMRIRALKRTLELAGFLTPTLQPQVVQSWAINPYDIAEGWVLYDTNRLLQRETITPNLGNDQVFFSNGPEFAHPRYGGAPWAWAALVAAVRNLRSHTRQGRTFVPTVWWQEGLQRKLTAEYLRHAVAAGCTIVDVFNPETTTDEQENRLANFVRELREDSDGKPLQAVMPSFTARTIQTPNTALRAISRRRDWEGTEVVITGATHGT